VVAAIRDAGVPAGAINLVIFAKCSKMRSRAGGKSLDSLTVLAAINDPYRADQPAIRQAGEWFSRTVGNFTCAAGARA
jgi:hypothetical protein